MPRRKEYGVQPPFEGLGQEPLPESIYQVKKGAVIYPWHDSRGVVQRPFQAKRIGEDIEGATGYEILPGQRADLYLDRRYWSLHAGALFRAYSTSVKEIKT
jgi:hypothetical protein